MTARLGSERGASLVLISIVLVVLMIIAGTVLDLGIQRNTRRTEQAAADAAAISAGLHLAGRSNSNLLGDPRAACRAALQSLKSTLAEFPTSATVPCNSLPATTVTPDCTDTSPKSSLSATGSGPWAVTIDYPVPAADIADPNLVGGVGTADGHRCERMRVALEHDDDTSFSRIMGISTLTTRAEAVVKGGPETSRTMSVPAFLLLERASCQVLWNSASGSGSDGVIVREVSADEGGRIHADSDASSCASNAYVVDSNAMSGGGSGVTVDDSSNGSPGRITSYATALGSDRGAGSFPGGVSTAATPGPIVSRRPFDENFNPVSRPAITDLHAQAWNAVNMSATTAAAAGYTVLGCNADGLQFAEKIFVDCANYRPSAATFVVATHVIVNGKVTVNNNRQFNLPAVRRFFVRGNGTGIEVKNGGLLNVNTGVQLPATATCASRLGPGAGGSTTSTTRFVSFGDLDISGTARLCQTTVYLGAPTPSYVRRTVTSGLPNCTPALPCPTSGTGFGGAIAVEGGYLDWSAPNQISEPATTAEPFEALALWTEASELSAVKSGGTLIGSGVFFLPNGPMQFQSPADTQPRNAQWIARSVQFNQGTLVLKPLPGDSVAVPQSGSWVLIR